MAISISPATQNDKIAIIEYLKHYGAPKIAEKRAECYIMHNHTLLAKEGNKIVGMLQWLIKEDPRAGVAEFEEVSVRQEYRNKGICSQLLKFAIRRVAEEFKKIKVAPRKIFLFVSKNNADARGLYEKHGFKCICETGCLFSDKDVELLYARKM
ncbi:MAG: GNAT family N-acetyltransferase [Nanoarchaeota archaeon]|nr:GNAT family N-acetyltransferase [Nanoarchaeota archaeon]MBU4451521.1 GNAT family N-acetyltransferase [Nanoarchaeota archaeon]